MSKPIAIINLAATDFSMWSEILFIKEYYKLLLFFLKENVGPDKYGKA